MTGCSTASTDPFTAPPPEAAPSSDGAAGSTGPADSTAVAIDATATGAPDADLSADTGDHHLADATVRGDSGLPLCGTTPCDPHANTCCVPGDGGLASYQCQPTTTASCPAGFAAFHCLQQSDCNGGLVCCGSYSLTSATAETQCLAGPCSTAQLCATDGECQNRQPCTTQTCLGQAVLRLCGLQTALGCLP